MSKNKTNEKRYQVIKPFLNGEKKLKEIENESGISYATLKRWVKSYKETGISGLEKKVRKDKSQHRSISDRTMDFIKKLMKRIQISKFPPFIRSALTS